MTYNVFSGTLNPTRFTSQHMKDLESFLRAISHAGMTLNLKKCEFAEGEVRFVCHLIGNGQRRVDPDRIKAIKDMKIPQSKKQVRQIVGFFSYFRDYIPNFSALAKFDRLNGQESTKPDSVGSSGTNGF